MLGGVDVPNGPTQSSFCASVPLFVVATICTGILSGSARVIVCEKSTKVRLSVAPKIRLGKSDEPLKNVSPTASKGVLRGTLTKACPLKFSVLDTGLTPHAKVV